MLIAQVATTMSFKPLRSPDLLPVMYTCNLARTNRGKRGLWVLFHAAIPIMM